MNSQVPTDAYGHDPMTQSGGYQAPLPEPWWRPDIRWVQDEDVQDEPFPAVRRAGPVRRGHVVAALAVLVVVVAVAVVSFDAGLAGRTRPTAEPWRPTPTELATAAFPPAAGYSYSRCHPLLAQDLAGYGADVAVACTVPHPVMDDTQIVFYVVRDTDAAFGLRSQSGSFDQTRWAHGVDFVDGFGPVRSYLDSYTVVRCYSDAPVCVKVTEGSQWQAETILATIISYHDTAGIAALADQLDGFAGMT